MVRIVRIALKTIAAVAVALGLVVALVWPWPAPEAQWRAAAASALARHDCQSAIAILATASDAGVADATSMRREVEQGSDCREAGEKLVGGVSFEVLSPKDTIEWAYGVGSLGAVQRWYVSTVLFLCAAPYNGMRGTDNTALSEALAEPATPLMELQRARRHACMGILEGMAEQLVDANDVESKEVAYAVLTFPPLNDTPKANLHYARLLLEQGFVPRTWAGRDLILNYLRDLAWLRLEHAAKAGDIRAIRLMIAIMHEGRYHERDDKQAYFWLLRYRRLGGVPTRLDNDIEAVLSQEDRDRQRWDEEDDHIRRTACLDTQKPAGKADLTSCLY